MTFLGVTLRQLALRLGPWLAWWSWLFLSVWKFGLYVGALYFFLYFDPSGRPCWIGVDLVWVTALVGTLVWTVPLVPSAAVACLFFEGVIGWIPKDPLLSSRVVWGY